MEMERFLNSSECEEYLIKDLVNLGIVRCRFPCRMILHRIVPLVGTLLATSTKLLLE